ncbi:cisplatin damage response ATP-dependent DNA ligase [Rhodomicrobium sp.]|uniref:cisplatin damage response ATP-dependent DNA ligase n=1 Tax=Rhodomicrobium sp. TaxID=2720632 RepID=UPI0039E388AB
MQAFAALLDRLYYTHSINDKAAVLKAYLARTPDPDRGFAVGVIAGTVTFELFKRALVRDLVAERVDPVLFDLSYEYVGEMSEAVAHIWPRNPHRTILNRLPPLHEAIHEFRTRGKPAIREYLALLLDNMTPPERWALLKLGTSTLRIGMSARSVKHVLAEFGGVEIGEIEEVWHAQTPPYLDLFAWLEGRAPKPQAKDAVTFHPVMLAHAIEETELAAITPDAFMAEWKYDGIRVQIVSTPVGKALFSRTGDDISGAFPDVLARVGFRGVLDGELIVREGERIASFNHLQQRLNRKSPDPKLIAAWPGHVILYDALDIDGRDLRALPLTERKVEMTRWFEAARPDGMELAAPLTFRNPGDLQALRAEAATLASPHIEGLMLKRLDSTYVAGRPKGLWYKWKRDPMLVDAVVMYAQRGTGRRSSFYSDYTFGLWQDGALSPIGKAYFGFTDEELKELDKWVRHHTVARFGPVREVEKALVFEVAFDAVHRSTRHKSGVALRFPRINRIRWDKPARDADELSALLKWVD